jgi:hypothetical protein
LFLKTILNYKFRITVAIMEQYDTTVISSLLKFKNKSISLELLAGLTGIGDMEYLNCITDTLVADGIVTKGDHNQINLISQSRLKLLAIRKASILCIDCKHWSSRAGKKYALKNAVEKQVERTMVFSKEIDFSTFGIEMSDDLHFIPILISWLVEDIKTYQNVPIVPIFQLSNFLNQIDIYKDEFKIISLKK